MAAKTRETATRETWDIDGRQVEVTSLDRVLWPGDDLTKRDMLDYYAAMAGTMLRYIGGYPVTLHVFPRGIDAQGYYRRRMPDNAPDWIKCVDYEAGSRSDTSRAPVIESAADLIWFANQGAIEFHMWSSHHEDIEHP